MIIRENISFERGKGSKKGLNIGEGRKIMNPTNDDYWDLPSGFYMMEGIREVRDKRYSDENRYMVVWKMNDGKNSETRVPVVYAYSEEEARNYWISDSKTDYHQWFSSPTGLFNKVNYIKPVNYIK